MPFIAIIDDRKEFRETIKRNIDIFALEQGWNSIDIDPLEKLEDYPHWIKENNIGVILIDERLDEIVDNTTNHVSYRGHEFVDYIRDYFKTLPIFIITSFDGDESLLERFKDVEGIIQREEFNKNSNNYIPRFIRSAQKFLETFEEELSELSELASTAAIGEIDPLKRERMKAIQTKIGYSFPSDVFLDRSDLCRECESILDQLEELRSELKDINNGN